MKKMWIIAAVACAALMVSCGSDPVAKAKEYEAQIKEAEAAGDHAKAEKILKEALEWEKSLSEADQKKLDEAGL